MTSAIAIINWNSGKRLRACIESLLATATNAQILVVDNASTDDSIENAQGFRNRVDFIVNSVNRGFAAAINQAFETTADSYVLVLNPDIRVMPGSVEILEKFLDSHPRAGAVGGYVNDRYLPRKFPTVTRLMLENLGMAKHGFAAGAKTEGDFIAVDQPAAAALLIRREAHESVNGFDEHFYPAWYEDVDFCRRLTEAGWEIYFAPQARFIHEGGYSAEVLGERFADAYYRNQMRYAEKHLGIAGRLAVRASIAAGMIGRMIGRPTRAAGYGRVLAGVFKEW